MTMVLLLAAWMWDRVLLDCSGHQERISNYYFQATVLKQVPGICPTGQGNQTAPCLVLTPGPYIPFGPNIGDPGTGTSVSTFIDPVETPDMLPIPPVGQFIAWPWPASQNVVAIDKGGNLSNETCH